MGFGEDGSLVMVTAGRPSETIWIEIWLVRRSTKQCLLAIAKTGVHWSRADLSFDH